MIKLSKLQVLVNSNLWSVIWSADLGNLKKLSLEVFKYPTTNQNQKCRRVEVSRVPQILCVPVQKRGQMIQ